MASAGPELELIGLKVSVYTRIVRVVLAEKGIDHRFLHANPFNDPPDAPLPELTRFARVPVLRHGDFILSETRAILSYLDALGRDASILPQNPKARARAEQVMGIIDSYGYWPLVRQVFAHRVFRPLEGLIADEAEIERGISAAGPVLETLNDIAAEGLVLNRQSFTAADIYVAPMVDYFAMAPEGAAALARHRELAAWWDWAQTRPSMTATAPDFTRLTL
ncbi:MAG: glutathione S-transferase family protein [Arenibacterium sp.]